MRRGVSPELARLADLQAGVVTTEQVVSLGQTRHSVARLIDAGQWQRLAPGLYLTVPVAADFAALAWAVSCWEAIALGSGRRRPAISMRSWAGLLLRPSTCWWHPTGGFA